MEESSLYRAPCRAGGRPHADSHDGGGEPWVGRAADSWRTAEIGDRRLSGDGREIHAAPTPASVPDLAHLLAESRRPDRGGRFFRGPDGDLPPLVRPGAPRSRSATHPAYRGHRTSDGGVDGPTTARGASMERGVSLPPPRSRSRVRPRRGHGEGDGDGGSPHGTARTVAKCVRRAIHRISTPRVL